MTRTMTSEESYLDTIAKQTADLLEQVVADQKSASDSERENDAYQIAESLRELAAAVDDVAGFLSWGWTWDAKLVWTETVMCRAEDFLGIEG